MIENDRVGGARNNDWHAGQGRAAPLITGLARVNGQTAVEMTSLWKPKNGFHRDLEISHRARDSHIPTSRSSSFEWNVTREQEPTRLCGEAQTRKLPMPNVASLRSRRVVSLITMTWTPVITMPRNS
jgi:hypothetical protein